MSSDEDNSSTTSSDNTNINTNHHTNTNTNNPITRRGKRRTKKLKQRTDGAPRKRWGNIMQVYMSNGRTMEEYTYAMEHDPEDEELMRAAQIFYQEGAEWENNKRIKL